MSEKIAGVDIPDTRLVADATEFVREAEPPLLFDHCAGCTCSGCCRGNDAV